MITSGQPLLVMETFVLGTRIFATVKMLIWKTVAASFLFAFAENVADYAGSKYKNKHQYLISLYMKYNSINLVCMIPPRYMLKHADISKNTYLIYLLITSSQTCNHVVFGVKNSFVLLGENSHLMASCFLLPCRLLYKRFLHLKSITCITYRRNVIFYIEKRGFRIINLLSAN